MKDNKTFTTPSSIYTFEHEQSNLTLSTQASEGVKQSISIPYSDLLEWLSFFDSHCEAIGALAPKRNIDKSTYMEDQKKSHKQAYQAWSPEEEEQLKELSQKDDFNIAHTASVLGRNEGAIRARLRKLGLEK